MDSVVHLVKDHRELLIHCSHSDGECLDNICIGTTDAAGPKEARSVFLCSAHHSDPEIIAASFNTVLSGSGRCSGMVCCVQNMNPDRGIRAFFFPDQRYHEYDFCTAISGAKNASFSWRLILEGLEPFGWVQRKVLTNVIIINGESVHDFCAHFANCGVFGG